MGARGMPPGQSRWDGLAPAVIAAYYRGASRREIEDRFWVPADSIGLLLRRHHVVQRRPQPPKQQDGRWDQVADQVVERYQRGDSLRSIAAATGVPVGSITMVLDRRGIPRTRRKRASEVTR